MVYQEYYLGGVGDFLHTANIQIIGKLAEQYINHNVVLN